MGDKVNNLLGTNKGLAGKFIKCDKDWLLVQYTYGDERIVSCVGLGKSGDFPVHIDSITEVKETKSYLTEVMPEEDVTIWRDSYNRLYLVVALENKNTYDFTRIDILSNKVSYQFISNIGYTYQLDGMTLVYKTNKLDYTDKYGKTYPSVKHTIEEVVKTPKFNHNMSTETDNFITKDISDEDDYSHDIVFCGDLRSVYSK